MTIKGVDWQRELKRLAVMPVFGGRKGRPYRLIKSGTLTLEMKINPNRSPASVHGKAAWSGRHIWLWVHPDASIGDIREIMLHELTHLIVPPIRGNLRDTHHPKAFYRKLKVARRQAAKRPLRIVGREAAVSTGNQLAGLPAAA